MIKNNCISNLSEINPKLINKKYKNLKEVTKNSFHK